MIANPRNDVILADMGIKIYGFIGHLSVIIYMSVRSACCFVAATIVPECEKPKTIKKQAANFCSSLQCTASIWKGTFVYTYVSIQGGLNAR